MTQGRHSPQQPLRWLTVVALFAALTLALISQFPRSERAADESFSSSIALQKKIYDDGGKADNANKTIDMDPPLDALLASAVFACAVFFRAAIATVRHIVPSYLVFFISAPPRAPPAVPSR